MITSSTVTRASAVKTPNKTGRLQKDEKNNIYVALQPGTRAPRITTRGRLIKQMLVRVQRIQKKYAGRSTNSQNGTRPEQESVVFRGISHQNASPTTVITLIFKKGNVNYSAGCFSLGGKGIIDSHLNRNARSEQQASCSRGASSFNRSVFLFLVRSTSHRGLQMSDSGYSIAGLGQSLDEALTLHTSEERH